MYWFFFVYILTPTPDIILKYPTPDNAGSIIYKDKADVVINIRQKS